MKSTVQVTLKFYDNCGKKNINDHVFFFSFLVNFFHIIAYLQSI